jgi:pilus assembly protein CpaE
MVAVSGGLDILSAPLVPSPEYVETGRMQSVIEYTRTMYDWIVLDLPVIFQRTSLVTIPMVDRTFLVSTSELPSLHLARRSITMLEQLGFPKDRFQVLVNRVSRRAGIASGDIEKLFKCPVYASFPNDYFSLHRAVTLGVPLSGDADLGRAIEGLATQLAEPPAGKKPSLPAAEKK